MARYRVVQQCLHPQCGAPELGQCCPVTTIPAGSIVQVVGELKAVEDLQVGDMVKFMDLFGYLAVKEAPTLEPE